MVGGQHPAFNGGFEQQLRYYSLLDHSWHDVLELGERGPFKVSECACVRVSCLESARRLLKLLLLLAGRGRPRKTWRSRS
jgi:hypothetical protein